jgi:hypothetical protein
MEFTQHLVFRVGYKISEKGFVSSSDYSIAQAVSQQPFTIEALI